MTEAPTLQQIDRTYVRCGGRRLIYFGGCDYFRLASHPGVLAAVGTGLKRFGLNVAASRRTTGNHVLFGRLEAALAAFFGVRQALLTSSGYVTNLAVTQALAGEFDHAFLDDRAHACLADAAALLGCPVHRFAHASARALVRQWEAAGRPPRSLVLTDGLFSHDGSQAPLREYLELLPREVVLLVDDAHAAGVLGQHGRGTVEAQALPRSRVIQTGTLSKAFGVYGGFIVAPARWHRLIHDHSRLLVGNTPLPLPLANGAMAALSLLRRNPSLRRRLDANIAWLRSELAATGLALSATPSPILAVHPRSGAQRRAWQRALLRQGVYPSFIRYPGGPPAGYFRFAVSSEHTPAQLQKLVAALTSA